MSQIIKMNYENNKSKSKLQPIAFWLQVIVAFENLFQIIVSLGNFQADSDV